MALKVVGAGLGRTGTMSLKLGLEKLLGEPCYHMIEVFSHPEHVKHWHSAAVNQMPDWDDVFTGYAAAVDWPASAFWPEISETYPDALVVLSHRDSDAWWNSAHETIFARLGEIPNPEWLAMVQAVLGTRFTADITDKEACIAAFERHNTKVRESVPPGRLLEWQASQGWEPLCKALNLPIPNEPFPRVNTREEWAARHAPPQNGV